MSHTVKVKVQLRNKTALGISVVELQGTVLGDGTHNLYQGQEIGYGFTLPRWSFPLVLKESGELAYDDYHGIWGNPADIDVLTQRYSIQVAKAAADAQGWMTERVGGSLLIFHPDGGTLTISAGSPLAQAAFSMLKISWAVVARVRPKSSRPRLGLGKNKPLKANFSLSAPISALTSSALRFRPAFLSFIIRCHTASKHRATFTVSALSRPASHQRRAAVFQGFFL